MCKNIYRKYNSPTKSKVIDALLFLKSTKRWDTSIACSVILSHYINSVSQWSMTCRSFLSCINRIVLTRWCYKKKTLSNWYFVSILQNLISLDNSILSTWPYHTKCIALVPWCPHILFCFWRIISNKSVKATYFLFIMCWFPRKRKVNIHAMNIVSTRHVTGLLEVVSLAIKI